MLTSNTASSSNSTQPQAGAAPAKQKERGTRPFAVMQGGLAVRTQAVSDTTLVSSASSVARPIEMVGVKSAVAINASRQLPESMPPMSILVVDDDCMMRDACCATAAEMGLLTLKAASVPQARAILQRQPVDMLLLDLKLPGGDGVELLQEIKASHPEIEVVVMTAYATVSSAVETMRIGAGNYLTKPFDLEKLTHVLETTSRRLVFDLESRQLRERLRTQQGSGKLVGRSPGMEKVYRIVSKVIYSRHPVLILGESGTGKEMVARSIHDNGLNAAKPFIPVDCSSLMPALIESELFGHVKGAFTGANRAKEGLFAAAGGGTIFLDEIGELPLDLQAKLLRALQEKEARPVGANHAFPIAARMLAATNRDLGEMVAQGLFRKDLYFRLNVMNVKLPPLRDRREDIPMLAACFLERRLQETGIAYSFSEDATALLMEYDWPGNVRELEHAIERACAMSSGPVLHLVELPSQMLDFLAHRKRADAQAKTDVQEGPRSSAAESGIVPIAEMERQAILSTIRQLKGDKLLAARLLGIGKTTLYRKLKEYGIPDGGEVLEA